MNFDENAAALQRDVPHLHTGKLKIVEKLKVNIQDAIDNIRKFKKDAGTSRSFSESYDDGRADAYVIVLGWIEDLEKE
jgi:hypothetical protein